MCQRLTGKKSLSGLGITLGQTRRRFRAAVGHATKRAVSLRYCNYAVQ